MSKNFQEIILTDTNAVQSMIGTRGDVSFSGFQGSETVTVTLTGDSVPIPVNSTTPINASVVAFFRAERLTFTAANITGATAISIKWYPVNVPY